MNLKGCYGSWKKSWKYKYFSRSGKSYNLISYHKITGKSCKLGYY